jgi:hypothetical protein
MEQNSFRIFKSKTKRGSNEKNIKIIERLRQIIFSVSFKEKHKKDGKYFKRNRKLSFSEIILFQLWNSGKSLGIEISRFLKELKIKEVGYSKQAYSKARMKIQHSGYIELNDALLEEFYEDEDYKKNKGYRLLGIDGSEIELQHEEELNKRFGQVFNNKESINASKAVVVYDLLNELVIDSELNIYNSSERKSAIEQLARIRKQGKQKQDIIVADRGFPSIELFSELKKMKYEFVIRYNGNEFLKESLPLAKSNKDEMEIEISLRNRNNPKTKASIKKILEKGYPDKLRLRIIKIKLSNKVEEYLITSILGVFTAEDFKEIYNLRWNEEIYFDFQKNVIEVENFTGKTVESVMQDYYSRILIGNLHSLIVSEAQEEIDEEIINNEKLKYEQYKINKNLSFGLMKDSIYNLLTIRDWDKEYSSLIKEAKKHKIAVIKNRTFPRQKIGNLKFPINKKGVL